MRDGQRQRVSGVEATGPRVVVVRSEALRPYVGFFAEVGAFPLREEALAWEAEALAVVQRASEAEEVAVWLELNHLPLRNGAATVSAHGRAWMPVTGLGVFPDREPPRVWTEEDFFDREYGQPLPPLMNQVLLLEGEQAAVREAVEVMAGGGALNLLGAAKPVRGVVEELSARNGAEIEELALTGMPFYVPLLTAEAVGGTDAAGLEVWLGGAEMYVREIPESRGVLFVLRGEAAVAAFARFAGVAMEPTMERLEG